MKISKEEFVRIMEPWIHHTSLDHEYNRYLNNAPIYTTPKDIQEISTTLLHESIVGSWEDAINQIRNKEQSRKLSAIKQAIEL